jgi:hypothetical protein
MDRRELLAEIAEAIHHYHQVKEETQKIIDRHRWNTTPPPTDTCFKLYEVD